MSLLTNKGKEAISTAISSSSQFSLVRIGFGDKQGSIYRKFVESDTSLVNEKFRINLDSVYYLPTVDNNTILKITANLTPEQSATMEAVTVREFGIYDNFNNLLIVGDTVPTITKDSNNNNGIDFEINLTLPTSEKVARVLVTSKEGEFSNAERIKLNNIEEGATKNNTDSFLLDRKNHTGKIDIDNVDGLVTILYSLETVEDNDDKLSGKVDKVTGKGLSANDYTDMEKNKLASIDINKIDNDIFDLEKRPYFMGRFQDEDEMLSLFFYDGNEEDDKKLIYNDMYYYNIGLNSVLYYNGGTWIKGNNLNIVDDLESTVPGDALDANQGRILKGLIDNITTILNSNETNLDTLQEIVNFIKINRDTLNTLTIGSISGLEDKLDTKVDKVSGKGLSSNDYTNIEKTAVSTIGDKQDKLISGSNIKTINNISLLGNGNIEISNTGGGHNVNTDVYSGRYGIIWDYASDTSIRIGSGGYTSIQSMFKRCVMNVDGTVKYYLHKDNSNFKEDGSLAIIDGTDGNVMVEVPKCYIRMQKIGTLNYFEVALEPSDGLVLSPSHSINGVEVEYRYYRAYEGHVLNNKLISGSGRIPSRSINTIDFRNYCKANGENWHMTDWYLKNLITMLLYIEFNTLIPDGLIGVGNNTGNDYGLTTGMSNHLGNKSSLPNAVNYMSYRGIENFYGSMWENVDGINIQNRKVFINKKNNPATFASNVYTGDYVDSGIILPVSGGEYIKDCNISPEYGILPSVGGGSNTTRYGDGFWTNTGNMIVYINGSAEDSTFTGPSCLNGHNGSSNVNVRVGCGISC